MTAEDNGTPTAPPQNRAPVARDERGRIVAGGGSLNPGGVPSVVLEMRRKLEAGADDAVATVIRLLESADEKVALAAAREVLDRVLGRPHVSLDVTVPTLSPVVAAIVGLAERKVSATDNEGAP